MAKILLNTFRPMCLTTFGRKAISKYNLPPFIDGSCRREPDFESKYPSITALCRGRACAPRLQVEDKIIYMTVKHNYEQYSEPHYRLVGIFEIMKRFEDHLSAADWYRSNKLPIPSNCLIKSNPPIPIDKTIGLGHYEMNRIDEMDDSKKEKILDAKLHGWDKEYWDKIKIYPVFLVCKSLFLDLFNPPILNTKMLNEIFGKIPATRTPPEITQKEYDRLILELANKPH